MKKNAPQIKVPSGPFAVRISGRTGDNDRVNGSYEPSDDEHNGRTVWVSRSARPLYLFHTGKARWVISKRVDEGKRCYAYVEDKGLDPIAAKGPWMVASVDGDFKGDPSMETAAAKPSDDKFVFMRMTLDQELDKYGLNNDTNLMKLWKRLDINGNNLVSLAELDRLVEDLVAAKVWPEWVNSKPALMRAFKSGDMIEGNNDGWIESHEFHPLLMDVFWYAMLWLVFDEVDSGDDRKLSLEEFTEGAGLLGMKLSPKEAEAEFRKIDINDDGVIIFVEFCAYVRNRVNPDGNAELDLDIADGLNGGKAHRKKPKLKKAPPKLGRSKVPGNLRVKSLVLFEEAEKKLNHILADPAELEKLWDALDANDDDLASLAEVDKYVMHNFPGLNKKPAIALAYEDTCQQCGKKGEEKLSKAELPKLVSALCYYNKLFWIFDATDTDRDMRIGKTEFQLGLVSAKIPGLDTDREFRKIDRDGDGYIIFEEFCRYFASKACPDVLKGLIHH